MYGFDIMFDDDLKPWVLEVNCLPSLSSSSMFDKQVKTQLITDCFSLIGIRGYNKNEMRKERQLELQIAKKEGRTPYPEKEPVFKTSMKIQYLEDLAGIVKRQPADPDATARDLKRQFIGEKKFSTFKEVMIDSGAEVGAGKGFTGDELLSRDEFFSIMDLEDEIGRTNQFERIYPSPSSCSYFYGFMEIKRYQNALYCAWLSTPKKIRAKIMSCNTAYYFPSKVQLV